MNYQEFTQYVSSDHARMTRSRIIVVPNKEDRQRFIHHFYNKQDTFEHVRVCNCIHHDDAFVPMPQDMLAVRLAERIYEINNRGKTAIITGLPGYFLLLEDRSVQSAFDILKRSVENSGIHAVWLLNYEYTAMNTSFRNPRFREQGTVVVLSDTNGDQQVESDGRFDMTPPIFFDIQWKSSLQKSEKDLQSYLSKLEEDDFSLRRSYVPVAFHGRCFPGLNPAIRQLTTLSGFMNEIYGLEEGLSDDALELIRTKLVSCNSVSFSDANKRSQTVSRLRSIFLGQDVPNTSYPKLIYEAEKVEREILIWLLKTLAKPMPDSQYDSWLLYVLFHEEFRAENFLYCYVLTAIDAVTELDSKQAESFAKERKDGLANLGIEKAQNEFEFFISSSQNIPTQQIAPWLNNGTESEKTELIARVKREKMQVLPTTYDEVYPEFAAYMTAYDLGNADLDRYFKDYRIAKLHDIVSPDLCEKAKSLDVLDMVKSRDVCVQEYYNDTNTALLFVDCFGVEYLPLIYSLMRKYVYSYDICCANIPTVTEKNPIQWPMERRISPVDKIDKICHFSDDGRNTPIASVLCSVLGVVRKVICPRIIGGLSKYKRILLTADHGSSRLAVTARNQGVSEDLVLPPGTKPDNWRYTKVLPGQPAPKGSRANLSETYWAVCGYNRFRKPGAPEYEVHGGITPEELLVPVIIFQNDGELHFGKKAATASEFVLDSDFDL